MNIVLKPYNKIKGKVYKSVVIRIEDDSFENINFEDGKSTFYFDECKFDKIKIINKSNIEFDDILIHFSFCLIKSIEIVQIQSKQISLHFHSCILEGNIKEKNINRVSFDNCITSSLILHNQKEVHFSIQSGNIPIKKWIRILKFTDVKSISQLLSLKQSIQIAYSQNIRFYHNDSISGKKGIFKNSDEKVEDYKIRYNLNSKQLNQLKLKFNIDYNKVHDISTEIKNYYLHGLSLTGQANGKLSIENTIINNLYIHNFSSESETSLYRLYPDAADAKLEIHNSNMNNTWFDNMNFDGYETLSFFRTRFSNARFTSCNFPESSLDFEKFMTLENIHYPDKKPENYYKDQYETFLQLRKSLDGTGNYYEGQKLGAISKDALRKTNNLSTSDRFILWTNKVSNNHGLSIKRPIIGLLLSSLIFYILYLLSIDRIFISTDVDWDLIGYYFSFLDPTHRKNFLINKEQFSIFTLTIDFINKIFVSFFIFQFISAFRKYINK